MKNTNTIPTITRIRTWTAGRVLKACIDNELYTCGTAEQYDEMLRAVGGCYTPSDLELYAVAKDIAEHSEGQTTTNVMFILENFACLTVFELDGHDDI